MLTAHLVYIHRVHDLPNEAILPMQPPEGHDS